MYTSTIRSSFMVTQTFLLVFSDSYQSVNPDAIPISALEGRGLDRLKKAVEEEILKSTGKQVLDLRVDLSSPQLRWWSECLLVCIFDLLHLISAGPSAVHLSFSLRNPSFLHEFYFQPINTLIDGQKAGVTGSRSRFQNKIFCCTFKRKLYKS